MTTVSLHPTQTTNLPTLSFHLPPDLEAHEPPEARGLNRDDVRLMISHFTTDHITHHTFRDLPEALTPGDVLVINTSGTRKAALPVVHPEHDALKLHLSTRLPADIWAVELRDGDHPFDQAASGDILTLPGGGSAHLLAPYRSDQRDHLHARVRLWLATLHLPGPLEDYLAIYGAPIRYAYVHDAWPIDYYQTVYATETGSAEMPSAGRAFTPQLLTRLIAKGVHIAPLILHTGVASLEAHEPPYEEYYRVPRETARTVNAARDDGRRVIAVGTTVVRALETVADASGRTAPGEGWTRLIVSPDRPMRAVTGLLTGFHEPRATHLAMLQALTGENHLRLTYAEALRKRYLWHEFGDLHLILP